jgi:dehydrogenase/reductase SDR family protein 1
MPPVDTIGTAPRRARAPRTNSSGSDAVNLEGSVALVAGASRGVGRGIAEALADAGAHVYASGRSIESSTLPLP